MQIEPIVLVGILLIGIILLGILVGSQSKQAPEWKSDLRKRANSIRNKVSRVDSIGKKQLLIEADKLLDHTLKNLKVPGRDLGDRLKTARIKFDKPQYQHIWTAHKARNSLVHELDYQISDDEIKQHVKVFVQAIEKLTN